MRKAKWLSARNSEVAGLFLEANPYHNGLSFNSDEAFQYAVRGRYAISNQDKMGTPYKCRCQVGANMCVDAYTEHYVSGCPLYGSRQYIHDQVKYALFECAKNVAEIETEMEDGEILRDPEDPEDERRDRPDLVMKVPYNNVPGARKCVVEVTVGNTVDGTQSGKLQCKIGQKVQAGKIAARKFVMKRNKYKTLASNRTMDLKVISIETGGFIFEDSLRFIKRLAYIAHKKRPDVEYYDMKRYMLTKISVALYSAMGTVINRRINNVKYHSAATLEDHRHQTEHILQAMARGQ